MNTTVRPSSPAGSRTDARSASPELVRSVLLGLGAFVAVAGIGLGIAIIAGATTVINLLVFALFTVLWVAFAAALGFSPATLDTIWSTVRSLPVVVQGVLVVLFLPIAIGLWIWERAWSLPVRLVLILALGAWNIYMFFPRPA